MTAQVREAAEKAIGQRGIVGDVYLFTAKKSKGPWTKDHVLKLWYRAQRLAGIDDVVGIHATDRTPGSALMRSMISMPALHRV